ncbi:MAG: hypothetical protein J5958_02350 [Clostridia bacterium]|nr:hypothetical protein [Clostridia bacterium]
MWPAIDDIKTTEDVLPFLNETINELKGNYNGKINAQVCQIEFILKNLRTTMSVISDISKIVGQSTIKEEYEEKKDIEKDRTPAYVINHDYKYEIYNDHLYYKLFTINIPEFYPIKIHVSAGIIEKEDVELDVNDLDRLKSVFGEIVCSDKVRMIIKKMLK